MKDAKGHGSNAKPIPGSPYHAKTNAELRYIIKDASEAERATRGQTLYNPNSGKREDTAGKYSDQVNDAATVLAYRDRGGKSDAPSDQLHSGTAKSDAAPVHDSMSSGRQYWGSYRQGNGLKNVGPHGSREEARDAALGALKPGSKVKEVSTGYGNYGPHFDIQWHRK